MSLRSMCCSMLTITALLSAQITPARAMDGQNTPTIAGYSNASAAAEITLEKQVSGRHRPGKYSREHAAVERATAPCRVALR